MYKNLIPNLISSTPKMINGDRVIKYNIDHDIILHHIELLQIRNINLSNINRETLNYYNYVIPVPKRLV